MRNVNLLLSSKRLLPASLQCSSLPPTSLLHTLKSKTCLGKRKPGPALIRGPARPWGYPDAHHCVSTGRNYLLLFKQHLQKPKAVAKVWAPSLPWGGKVQAGAHRVLGRIYAERSSFSCPLLLWCNYGSNTFIQLGKGGKGSVENPRCYDPEGFYSSFCWITPTKHMSTYIKRCGTWKAVFQSRLYLPPLKMLLEGAIL